MSEKSTGAPPSFTVAVKWVYRARLGATGGKGSSSLTLRRAVLGALMTLHLDWDSWTGRAANATIADAVGSTPRAVSGAVNDLQAAGILTRVNDRPGYTPKIILHIERLRLDASAEPSAEVRSEPLSAQPQEDSATLEESSTPPRREFHPPRKTVPPPLEDSSTVPVFFSVKDLSFSEPPYPPGGDGARQQQEEEETMTKTTIPSQPDPVAEFREKWDAAAGEFYPGQPSQQWDGGRLFASPRDQRRQAHVFEHGEWLPRMLALYVEACKAGDRAFGQRDFSSQGIVNQLRAWAERGARPFWAKRAPLHVATPGLTGQTGCCNVTESGAAEGCDSQPEIEWY